MRTDPNSPAMPLPLAHNGSIMPENEFLDNYYAVGLKKREVIAISAMQGLLASRKDILVNANIKLFAKHSVQLADALINELNKTES